MQRPRQVLRRWPGIRRRIRPVLVTAVSLVVLGSLTAVAWGGPPWGGPPGPCLPPGQERTPPGGQYGGPTPPTDQYTPPGAGSGPPGQPSGVAGSQYGCPPGLQYGG